MALREPHRSTILRALAPIVGEEEATTLVAQFPSRDVDEPATRDFVRAEIATLRAEVATLRADMSDRFERQGARTTATVAASTGLVVGAVTLATLLG